MFRFTSATTRLPLTFSLLATIACGGEAPNLDVTVESRTALISESTRLENVVGVTVDPVDGKTYVLDAKEGIYVESAQNKLTRFRSLDFVNLTDRPLQSTLTDFVALGNGQFAMTALNDGFLYDTTKPSFEQHFCYVPGEIVDEFDPIPIVQLTNSLAYDAAEMKMYAAPRTMTQSASGEIVAAQIGQFDIEGGEGYGWMDLGDLEIDAGGLAVLDSNTLLLGQQDKLHTFDLTTGTLGPAIDLAQYGVDLIDGAAMTQKGTLLIVDGSDNELVEIRVERLLANK